MLNIDKERDIGVVSWFVNVTVSEMTISMCMYMCGQRK